MALAGRISLDKARAVTDHILDRARQDGLNLSIAIVDVGGSVIAAARMDEAAPLTAELALAKAKMSAHSYHPTLQWMHACRDMPNLMTLPGIIAAGGGSPILIDGLVVGGIGVSGATDDQDDVISRMGVDYLVAGCP